VITKALQAKSLKIDFQANAVTRQAVSNTGID